MATYQSIVKKIVLYMLLAVVAAFGGLFLKTLFAKNILVLKDGNVIAAEKIWSLGDTTYYRINKSVRSVKKTDVRRIFSKGHLGSNHLAERVAYCLKATTKKLVPFIAPAESRHIIGAENGGIDRNRGGFMLLILLLLSVLSVVLLVKRRSMRLREEKRRVDKDSIAESTPYHPLLSNVQDIEKFFLNVFRRQVGAAVDAPAKIIPVLEQQPSSHRLYDLQVEHQGKWKSRRIAIGLLGEGTGSKSQCFYVVYDTHMVIKVPSAPIKDFNAYVRCIKQDAAVIKRLAPLECIVPNISMVLEKIKIVPDTAGLTEKTREEKYIHLLETYPKLQHHLKIGDTFVFFMNLSTYRFLGQIMSRLHYLEEEITNETSADADIIWDYNEFENKYGEDNGALCFDLHKVYAEFHKRMKNQSKIFGQAAPLNEKEKMQWFLLHFMGKDFVERPRDLPALLVTQIDDMLDNLTDEHADVSERYKNLVGEYVRNRSFYRKKSQFEGIITNLLSLLAWLEYRNVAMRDIKPDNLMVAGDLESHPMLLASAKDYTIGLIDVETAVVIEKEGKREIKQPQLGGTPLYATPSHFFTNNLLGNVYKDVAKILILQDWFAVIGIIYELITGEKLFLKTGNKIHRMVQKLRFADKRERHMPEVYRNVNRSFWHTAIEEFEKKMDMARPKLNAVHAVIPEHTKKWFEQDWGQKESEGDNLTKMLDSLENGAAKLPANILLETMFNVVMHNMLVKQPDAVATGAVTKDTGKKGEVPMDSAPDTRILGFTFTI